MYFNPNETYKKAILSKDVDALRALLVGIIGSDPTFATTEYEEACNYIRKTSEKLNGEPLYLEEKYEKQENEYEKQGDWDEKYFQMQLLWLRYNFAPKERLDIIRKIGCSVYKNKPTLGKTKKKNAEEKKQIKKEETVIATGNGEEKVRLSDKKWFESPFFWIALAVVGIIIVICYFIFHRS